MDRREFMKSSVLAGAGLALAESTLAQAPGKSDGLAVGIIGAGKQGMVLLRDCMKIKGVRFTAVCDIWSHSQRYASRTLGKYKQAVNVYEDYREMLAKEKNLDAVIVATPDFMHAEHAIACLQTGKHVYCEKEMSHVLENAATMVGAARDTGKLLQIGHQRRSNPVYMLTLGALVKGGICGRLTNAYGQWNRPVQEKFSWPQKYAIPDEVLQKYGYASMDHFRNWRWYRKYSAGPIADLGSHQIDIFSWFFNADPSGIVSLGGKDYYGDREWYEDVLALFEYTTGGGGKTGSARAFYQVLNTNGFGNYYERFSGDRGSVTISEDPRRCYYSPEAATEIPAWLADSEPVQRDGATVYPLVDPNPEKAEHALAKISASSATAMAEWSVKNVHQLHLENFFAAVRAGDKKRLTCPPEAAYATAVAVLNVVPAIESGKKIVLAESDYRA